MLHTKILMFLLFNEAKSRFTIKNVSRGGLLVGKKGWAFWMIYPHFVIGPWFRARKHATLAFPNTEQTGTLAIKRTRRTQIYVSLPQLQFPAKKNCYTRFSLFACRKVSANCSFQRKFWPLNCNSNGEKQLLGLLSLEAL